MDEFTCKETRKKVEVMENGMKDILANHILITNHIKNVNERIDRHKDMFIDILNRLQIIIDKHDKIIIGDERGEGLINKVNKNLEVIKHINSCLDEKRSNYSKLVNFSYRTIIAIILGYIAMKVGLK